MRIIAARYAVLSLAVIGLTGQWGSAQATLKVCPDPSAPCRSPHKTFAPYELSFVLPRTIRPNTDYKSAPFYAVVWKTAPLSPDDECDQGEFSSKVERERRQVQALFPRRKVFASHQCPDMGAISYSTDGKPYNYSFIGVYGGMTRREAEQVRTTLKRRYPGATVQRIQAVFQRIIQ